MTKPVDAATRSKLNHQREQLVALQSDLRLALRRIKKLRDTCNTLQVALLVESVLLVFALLGLTGALQ